MSNNAPYIDPVIAKYIELIKAANAEIKTYFVGDPVKIAVSLLPCCIITKNNSLVRFLDSANDEHLIGLNITVVTDVRSELSTEDNISKVAPGVAKLYDIIEGRDSDYKLKTSSILNVLRTNQPADTTYNLRTDLGNPTQIDYGTTLRNRNPEQWSVEATIQTVVNFIQLR